jgi:hypothetical protein
MDLFTFSGATFSPCQKYRYRLWRLWDETKPSVAFVMLNPSTATDTINDPTVERCQRRAQAMGFGRLEVANIFALRSTNPKALYLVDDPIGADNDEAIVSAARNCTLVVCAWGTHSKLNGRGEQVLNLLKSAGVTPSCLGINADKSPKHPLYVGYDVLPTPMA